MVILHSVSLYVIDTTVFSSILPMMIRELTSVIPIFINKKTNFPNAQQNQKYQTTTSYIFPSILHLDNKEVIKQQSKHFRNRINHLGYSHQKRSEGTKDRKPQ